MTQNLFTQPAAFEALPIADADVRYLSACPLACAPQVLLRRLIDETPWRSDSIRLFGKTVRQPRLSAWYADDDIEYTYSGLTLAALPWTTLLSEVKGAIEGLSGAVYNSVLINYYRDHRDSMGMHSDDEPELGETPDIASLSVGEPRVFIMKHRHRKDIRPVRLLLESGSLVQMRGETQRNWKHGINKLTRPCGPRVNLTFRRIMQKAAGR